MLPWQKKRKEAEEAKLAEEKAAKIKEMNEINTGVIDDKQHNESIIKQATEKPKKEETVSESNNETQIELDQIEVGILNKYRLYTQNEMYKIELMTNLLEQAKKTNELLEKLIEKSV